MKMRFKRFLSGFMAVATLASVIVQPVTVSASELEPETTSFEQQYPELQDVQDTLDKDEIVEAKDIEIPYGEEFEVEVDLSGIEGVNEKKVKVLFHDIGFYGSLHRNYLKDYKGGLYSYLTLTGELWTYLADLNEQCVEYRDFLMNQIMEQEGITEELKSRDQMEWVRRANNVRSRVDEIILNELVYV